MTNLIAACLRSWRSLVLLWRDQTSLITPTDAEMTSRAFIAGRADCKSGEPAESCPFVRLEEQALWRLGYAYEQQFETNVW